MGGVLGLGVVAGGLLWAFGYSDDESSPVTAQVAPPPAVQPMPAAPVLAVAAPSAEAKAAELALAGKTGPADERDVSAATILDTTTAGEHPNQPNDELTRSLSRSLEGPSNGSTKDELTAAFDRPAGVDKHERTAAHAAKTHDKPVAKDKDKEKDRHKAERKAERKAEQKAERKAEAARKERADIAHAAKKRAAHGAASDSDASLLEALMSHLRPSKGKGAKKAAPSTHCAPAEVGEGATPQAGDCKAAG